jgi:CO dehydrogenase nickel-insertion accessory protein CooC1
MKSWFIENPITKDLVKNLKIRMGAQTDKEFIIVMKAPTDRVSYNLASFLNIRLADSPTTAKIEKRLKPAESGAGELEDIKIQTVVQEQKDEEREIKVMVIGKLDNPRI